MGMDGWLRTAYIIANVRGGDEAETLPHRRILCQLARFIKGQRMPEYSNYQRKVISRYYDNRDQIDFTALSETVTNLYLAETDKKKVKLWKSAEDKMLRLGVPKSRVEHVVTTADPALLAEVVNDLQNGNIS